MKTGIIIQPTRFNIIEEEGCSSTVYSYVGYILIYGPPFVFSLGCAIFARESPCCDNQYFDPLIFTLDIQL